MRKEGSARVHLPHPPPSPLKKSVLTDVAKNLDGDECFFFKGGGGRLTEHKHKKNASCGTS